MDDTLIFAGFITKLFVEALSKPPSLPVPFQGRRHGNGLIGFKKPATIQERRFNEVVDEVTDEAGRRLLVRAKRLNLPNGREDRNRTVQRSWKEHRSTQYK